MAAHARRHQAAVETALLKFEVASGSAFDEGMRGAVDDQDVKYLGDEYGALLLCIKKAAAAPGVAGKAGGGQ